VGPNDAKIYRWDYSPADKKNRTGGMKDARIKCRDCNAVVSLKSGCVIHKRQTRKANKGKPCPKTNTGYAAEWTQFGDGPHSGHMWKGSLEEKPPFHKPIGRNGWLWRWETVDV
jgi:hypothetical protein